MLSCVLGSESEGRGHTPGVRPKPWRNGEAASARTTINGFISEGSVDKPANDGTNWWREPIRERAILNRSTARASPAARYAVINTEREDGASYASTHQQTIQHRVAAPNLGDRGPPPFLLSGVRCFP
jgi:hypothetical protein